MTEIEYRWCFEDDLAKFSWICAHNQLGLIVNNKFQSQLTIDWENSFITSKEGGIYPIVGCFGGCDQDIITIIPGNSKYYSFLLIGKLDPNARFKANIANSLGIWRFGTTFTISLIINIDGMTEKCEYAFRFENIAP